MRRILLLSAAAGAIAIALVSCSTAPPPSPRQAVSTPRRAIVTDRDKTARHPAPPSQSENEPAPTTQAPPAVTVEEAPSSTPPAKDSGARSVKRLAGYPGEVTHTKSQNRIALTFDAGASPEPVPDILAALKSAGLHVTFFVTGKWCERFPDMVKAIAADGHEIANHTWSHPDLRKLKDADIVEQLSRTEDIVMRLTGKSTKPFFRPPFGGRNKHVLSVAGQQGYTSIFWSLDSLDAYKKGITAEEIERRVLDRIQGGDIVLLHCGSAPTAAVLPDLIGKLDGRGYQIVKVSDLISGD